MSKLNPTSENPLDLSSEAGPVESVPALPLPPAAPPDVLEMADSLFVDAPEVSPGFAESIASGKKPRIVKAAAVVVVDKDNHVFDRRFCVVGHNDAPRKTPGGRWEMRKNPDSLTGARFVRSEVLRKPGGVSGVKVPAGEPVPLPRPVLDLPGDDSPGMEEGPGAGVDPLTGSPVAVGPSPEAVALAGLCEFGFWSFLAPIVAPPVAVQEVKATMAPVTGAALAEYFDTLENLPVLPPWAGVVLAYGIATKALIDHKASAQKVLTLREKIARWWLNRKAGRVAAASAPVASEDRRAEVV